MLIAKTRLCVSSSEECYNCCSTCNKKCCYVYEYVAMITSLNCIRFLLICFLSRFLLVCLFVIFCYCCRCFVIFLVLFNWSTRFFFWSTWFWRINWWLIRINRSFILFKNSCYCVVISYSVWECDWCCICIKVVDFFAGFVCYFPAFECIYFIWY